MKVETEGKKKIQIREFDHKMQLFRKHNYHGESNLVLSVVALIFSILILIIG